jgi:GDP-L-fucose synthase
MNKTDKIYIAGHNGLVGSSILRLLQKEGYSNLIYKTRKDLDLTNQVSVSDFFRREKPEYVFLAAAKVGGIHANNTYPADFIVDNIQIQTNIIKSSFENDVKKLLFMGSVCIYPKYADIPVKESSLLTGMLEPTNDAYAIAKIAGIKMCQAYRKQYGVDYISTMPCNLYGINDNFHPTNSHVLPALIRRFHEAKINNLQEVVCWGDGSARREFLYADDVANASLFLMNHYSSNEIINIGCGEDYTIKEVVELIKNVVGYSGTIVWDITKSNGTPKRLLDTSKIFNMGWRPKVNLEIGLKASYEWYVKYCNSSNNDYRNKYT